MNRISRLIFIALITLLLGCVKDNPTELNIIYRGVKDDPTQKGLELPLVSNPTISIFPNPFLQGTNLFISGTGAKEIFITNDEGGFQRISISDEQFILDFSNEKRGSYYCEFKIGNQIYREHLIKVGN